MRTLVQRLQESDPSYDPVELALAQISELPGFDEAKRENPALTFRQYYDAARGRVVLDGNYGPFTSETWAEDGRRPYDVETALAVLEAVSDCICDYREFVYVGTDPETDEPIDEEQTTATAEDIRRCVFRSVVEIYGGLPW